MCNCTNYSISWICSLLNYQSNGYYLKAHLNHLILIFVTSVVKCKCIRYCLSVGLESNRCYIEFSFNMHLHVYYFTYIYICICIYLCTCRLYKYWILCLRFCLKYQQCIVLCVRLAVCANGTVFDKCANRCPHTCDHLSRKTVCVMTDRCRPGCRCADGLVLQDGLCVKQADCRCPDLQQNVRLSSTPPSSTATGHFVPIFRHGTAAAQERTVGGLFPTPPLLPRLLPSSKNIAFQLCYIRNARRLD